jgi:CheY-like chemotaxis protein
MVATVSDQGVGFSPTILDIPAKLTGFGLLSLRERACHVGGSFTIVSAPGQGSCFTLTVPIEVESSHGSQPTKSKVGHQPRDMKANLKYAEATGIIRVLFADDHKVMRQGLIRLLSGQPDICVVGEAANGREALEKTHQLQPDVVVMDVAMPEMDGVEATRRIKAELPAVRVIGLSMYEEEQLALTMRQAGAETFLSKTACAADLLTAIYGTRHPAKVGHVSG